MIKTGHIKSESGRNILLTDITPSKELVDFEKSKRKRKIITGQSYSNKRDQDGCFTKEETTLI